MVDVKISGLPAGAALTGSEAIPAVQGGANVKLLVSAIRAGLVKSSGDEGIDGTKAFSAQVLANGGIAIPSGVSLFLGGASGSQIQGTTGHLILGQAGGANQLMIFRPRGILSTANQTTLDYNGTWNFGGDATAKAASRASLGAVGNVGDEDIAGVKTYTGSQVRYSSTAPGHWFNEIGGNFSLFQVLDGDIMQWQLRNNGFANSVIVDMPLRFELANKVITTDYVVRPRTTNKDDLGTGTYNYRNLFVQNAPVTGSDKRKKKNLRHMTDVEEAAFLEVAELESVWEWNVGDRIHGGPTVQDARDVMLNHGLDPWAYSCFCHDSWPAKEAVWREWPAREEAWEEWPAQDAVYDVVQATYDDDGQVLTPEIHIMVSPAVEAGRRLISEAVEAGRELLEPAVEAGESFSFRVGELHAWMLAAMARRDRREREAAELRLASIEQRLAVLESGK
ncbi:hypothetical protein N5E70_15250 [Stenotrophomonas sp. GD03712]|uniref:tail fiber domain-containing protein n=1 Tax=Stenotrophomonas sp. GD03712 TaxID=2975371 RepID=UPI0024477233|nr:hypothetical protein [Stenotrophomonas sp. GD03712]MDH1486101.1 hypothetical protein [Stenotrophomonas sp. GD03712]